MTDMIEPVATRRDRGREPVPGAATGRPAPPDPVPIAKLQAMLLDPDVPDETIRPYLMLDDSATGAFQPAIRVDPRAVQEVLTEAAIALGGLNGIARWRRRQRYRRRLASWDGPRLVSEGDSWFQYPFLLTDTIDHLANDHLILSLGAAGDLLADMLGQDELTGTVVAERPDAVLLSAGGNDLLGAGGLTRIIERHDGPRDPDEYLGPTFEAFLRAVLADYRRIVATTLSARPGTPVICHGYDRALPAGGRWLGRPLAASGIIDPTLQAAIVSRIVDRFQIGLEGLAAEAELRGHLHVIDARGTVGADEWHDELHPTDEGYAKVAALFRSAIGDAIARGRRGGTEGTVAATASAPVAFAPPDAGTVAAAALQLANAHDRATLLREAGRRDAVLSARLAAPLATDLVSVPANSVEGTGAPPSATVLDPIERKLFDVLCRNDPRYGVARNALRSSVDDGDRRGVAGVLASHAVDTLRVPPFLASVAVALVLPRLSGTGWRGTCDRWTREMNTRAAGVPVGDDARAGPSDDAPVAPAMLDARLDDVGAAAKRPVNGTRRILSMLAPSDGAPPDLSAGARREAVGQLRRKLEAKGDGAPRPRAVIHVTRAAEAALSKIAAEGEAAELTLEEGIAMEAVVVAAEGKRPVLYVQDDRITPDPTNIGEWSDRFDHFANAMAGVASAVCRIEAPWSAAGYAGTGFAVGPGLVLTNRHVLEAVAVERRGANGFEWAFGPNVQVDFAAEKDRDRKKRFTVTGVALAPQPAIEQRIDFARLDLAVLRCAATDGFPTPLELEADASAFDRGREVYAVGFPARPQGFFADDGTPPAGHEFVDVQEALFDSTFGVKRWSPGRLMDVPGSLPGDERGWVVNHDATTLRGSSGSCVVDFASDATRVMALHFGGRNRTENWAHALHAVRDDLAALGVNFA